jgi:hypothetical protein
MTTQELKEANKNIIPNSETDDEARLHTIINDIMAKKKTSSNVKECDETELVINLEHAHGKINAILNRVMAMSYNDNTDDIF